MLSPVNDNTETYISGLENFFLPVLSFSLNGDLKFNNKAAVKFFQPVHNITEQPQISSFFNLFNKEKDFWQNLVSRLMMPDALNFPLAEQFNLQLNGSQWVIDASFCLASQAEFPEIQCAIHKFEKKPEPLHTLPDVTADAINTEHNILFKSLGNLMPAGTLMVFNSNLEYTFIEDADSGLFIADYKLFAGKKTIELHSLAYTDVLQPLYEDALQGKISHTEYQSENGNWFYISVGPKKKGIDIDGGFVMAYNINAFKRAEVERDKKIEELWYTNNQLKIENGVRKLIERNMYEQKFELEQKNQELEQFAYVASHDLQEPLRMVSSYTQLLGNRYNDKLDEEAREFISFAVEGATRMQSLITDLLSYSRIGRKEMTFEKINLDIIIQIVKRNLSILLQETDAEVNCDKFPFVQADASQLVQLFQNLISNAIKFRQNNVKPVINITTKNIGKFYRICVEDNGIGLSMDYKDRIFQIFQRLHTRDKYPGTGIGLAICKKIVERHGGQIWVESKLNEGTRFYFTLSR